MLVCAGLCVGMCVGMCVCILVGVGLFLFVLACVGSSWFLFVVDVGCGLFV